MTRVADSNQVRIETLQALMDRLCASDLTLEEARRLREQLAGVLNGSQAGSAVGWAASTPRDESFGSLRAVS